MTTPTITLNEDSNTPDAFRLAEALTVLTAGALQPAKVGDAHFVNLPPGYAQADITKLVEDAFKGYIDAVAKETGYTVLLGKA